ncbi:limonene-1,2-epoxide hydrolase family protein [Williamsia sterculiae]|uniref:Limonene-1,2-epoxide hydrolase n=1 Tax=Williamsia sterculiae TaxID=1344003 RepID=A0A1N7DNR9_9NOCA|nr:limonene-1,2-epoxide hydrolase family protein [Williamsia sterculiae]SIR77512.1 limonene-1,2-epoxide hydrolase [Williamsia sterculiae]
MTSQPPIPAHDPPAPIIDSQHVVSHFLTSMAVGDVTAAVALVDDHIDYTNVSLPTLHGKKSTAAVLGLLAKPWAGFGVVVHNIVGEGDVVLTERTDELKVGPLVAQFWVCGRFEVREGRITVWRDYFDWFDVTKGLVRGLVAIVVPPLRRRLPAPEITG